jgi:hypothetical protein
VNKKQKLDSPFTEVVQIEAYRGEPKLSTLLRELPWSSNRSLSPALIAGYQTRLPDKKLLQASSTSSTPRTRRKKTREIK